MRVTIREARELCNMTQEQLARLAKIGRSTLSEIEKGRHVPRVTIAIRLARALGKNVEDLFVL
ncbi:hypothetical protein SDC9_160713 [bioreactor metagenome]|uniref:HTH cro/C1-type domain-containing protein n=1 Tax=bioreactor metagenome TaxID=1076179 RepID=A0A645FIN8_9ZZZZ